MAAEWGYDETNGPETWCKIYPSAKGNNQSPIDIKPVDLKQLQGAEPLSWTYAPDKHTELINPGYCWKVHVSGKGSALKGGPLKGTYTLEQFHCHWGKTDDEGSEHTIDGKPYSGELHLVHWNSSKYKTFEEALKHPDGLCVLGVFLKVGRVHTEIQKIVDLLPKIIPKGSKIPFHDAIDPRAFLPKNSGYFTYQGSLTTPPCSECVVWVVFKEPIEVSSKQLAAFRKLSSLCGKDEGCILKNARPPLPVGEREVLEYSNSSETNTD